MACLFCFLSVLELLLVVKVNSGVITLPSLLRLPTVNDVCDDYVAG
jgi:hypothetical protein